MSNSLLPSAISVALISLALTAACENVVGNGGILQIDEVQDAGMEPTDGAPVIDTGVVVFEDAGNPDSRIPPKPDLGMVDMGMSDLDMGTPDMGAPDLDMGTPDMGTLNPITRASVGTRCAVPAHKLFLVLSDAPGACTEDAMRIANPPGSPVVIYAELPNPPALGPLVVVANVCLTANCEMLDLQLDLTDVEVGVRIAGTWRVVLTSGEVAEGAFDAPWCNYDLPTPGMGVVAEGLTLSEVSVYQSVKVNVVENAAAVTQRNAPLISSRPGLVRVFVDRDTGFTNRNILARLTLQGPNQTDEVLENTILVSRDSEEEESDSTFNFLLTEDQIKTDTRFHIGLYEPDAKCGAITPGTAVFPSLTGTAELGVDASGTLRIVMVPVRYNADGSGRLPDTSATQMQRYYDLMYAMFPVSGLELTVRQPMDFGGAVQRNGNGWSNLLQAIMTLRANDQAPDEVYYYGIFDPAASFGAYCQGQCIVGLGAVPRRNDTYSRAAIGMGFSGDSAAETFAHELGHALGRRHAPCRVSGDPNYPYNGGRLGVYGYDLINSLLKHPEDNRDLMGYCNPTWISDYTYSAMYDRIAFVVPTSPLWHGPRQPWRSLLQAGGTIQFTGQQLLERAPQGAREEAAWILADGNQVATQVVVYDLDHVADEIMMVAEPPIEAVQLELRGQRINLLP